MPAEVGPGFAKLANQSRQWNSAADDVQPTVHSVHRCQKVRQVATVRVRETRHFLLPATASLLTSTGDDLEMLLLQQRLGTHPVAQ